jgi:uncharacterized protein YegP (UPF0339 family)
MWCWKRPKYTAEIHTSASGQFYWTLKAANGETLCHSEMYTTEAAALETARKVSKAKIVVETGKPPMTL